MKLLFLTQVLDRQDAVLGFVSRWVAGLAGRCARVRVVALEAGDVSDLPGNVDVRVVGRRGRLMRWLRYRTFLSEALLGEGFDVVLAHMVPRYALVAARPASRTGARLYLWYTHKGVDERLRRAVPLVRKVFTASPESLRVETDKAVVTGHGIDLAHFEPAEEPPGPPRLLSVGRLTPKKDPLTVLDALARLRAEGRAVELDLVGAGLTRADDSYAREVRARIDAEGLGAHAHLLGAVPYLEIPASYRRATLAVNASHTGSLDKVLLEAMASGRPVLSCNDAAPGVFAPLGEEAERLLFAPGDGEQLARRIGGLLDAPAAERAELGRRLRAVVAADHDVERLLDRLVAEMQR